MAPELLPEAFRPWIAEYADRLQVPIEEPAVSVIVAASGAIGRRCAIESRPGWLCIPNVWGAIVTPPSRHKSQSLGEGVRFLRELEGRAAEEWIEERLDLETGLAEEKAKYRGIEKRIEAIYAEKSKVGDPLAILRVDLRASRESVRGYEDRLRAGGQRFVLNDSSYEALGERFIANPQGLTVVRDELAGLLGPLEEPKNARERVFYLEGWEGREPGTVDRIGRGTIRLPPRALALLGAIQPGRFQPYVDAAIDGGRGADGLLQRFQLLVWAEPPTDYRSPTTSPSVADIETARQVFQWLVKIPFDEIERAGGWLAEGVPVLPWAPDARQAFEGWMHDLELRLRAGTLPEVFCAHLGKYRSLMPSLSLIFHLVEIAAENRRVGPVSLDAASLAADWCAFLELHARKIYAVGEVSAVMAARTLGERILYQWLEDPFTVRDLNRKKWKDGLSDPCEVREALSILEDHNWIRLDRLSDPKGGRPSETVLVNPRIDEVEDLL